MRDEEKTRRLFTDSVDHLQLDMQIDWNGLNRAKQSSCICWVWAEELFCVRWLLQILWQPAFTLQMPVETNTSIKISQLLLHVPHNLNISTISVSRVID